jgi:hypothetical protein
VCKTIYGSIYGVFTRIPGVEPHQIRADGWAIGHDDRFPLTARVQQALVFARFSEHDNLYAHPMVRLRLRHKGTHTKPNQGFCTSHRRCNQEGSPHRFPIPLFLFKALRWEDTHSVGIQHQTASPGRRRLHHFEQRTHPPSPSVVRFSPRSDGRERQKFQTSG